MNRHSSLEAGFTLLEIMVALVLLSLVSLMAWRGLDAVAAARNRLEVRSDETLVLLRVLGQLERDVTRNSALVWSPEDGLALTRPAGPGQWQRVHWYVRSGRLWRAVGEPGWTLPLAAPGQAHAVLDSISAWNVRAWHAGQGWGAATEALTPGFEFSLHYRGDTYRTVVVLP